MTALLAAACTVRRPLWNNPAREAVVMFDPPEYTEEVSSAPPLDPPAEPRPNEPLELPLLAGRAVCSWSRAGASSCKLRWE